MKTLIFFLLATVSFAQGPSPTYIFTVRVSGSTVSLDKVDVVTPTPTPMATVTPTIPSGPTPTPTPIALYVGWSAYPNATDYKVYYKKQDGSAASNFNSGNVTKTKITFPVETKWLVTVKPLNVSGVELTTSNELSYP